MRPNVRSRKGLEGVVRISVICAAALLGPSAHDGLAQGPPDLDAGRLEIRSGDRRVGVESFRIWREGGEVRAFARLAYETGPLQGTKSVAVWTDGRLRPMRYGHAHDADRGPEVRGTWTGARLRLHIIADDGERWKEFHTPGRVAVLEPGVAHHYELLLLQLGDVQPGARVEVIRPGMGDQETATVAARGRESLRIAGADVNATRYDLEIGNAVHRVWLDDRNRILRTVVGDLVSTRLPENR